MTMLVIAAGKYSRYSKTYNETVIVKLTYGMK